jgi:hypothetical protein
MEIIVEGHKIDTLDIWDIVLETNTREVYVLIKLTDKPNMKIGRKIPYETYQSEYNDYWSPFEKLFKSLMIKWEKDKAALEIFKI